MKFKSKISKWSGNKTADSLEQRYERKMKAKSLEFPILSEKRAGARQGEKWRRDGRCGGSTSQKVTPRHTPLSETPAVEDVWVWWCALRLGPWRKLHVPEWPPRTISVMRPHNIHCRTPRCNLTARAVKMFLRPENIERTINFAVNYFSLARPPPPPERKSSQSSERSVHSA